ncbi:MAG TPA: ATP/GTP-binding protein [Candidatus Thermoplasmatota archaeon]|nr:ATP/GTP-binding protein [Candidatus Thermoplasmatota archaeon]
MADEEPVYVYIVGTAGSGKSRFTWAMQRWLKEHGIDCTTLNLDPGAEMLPYSPDVDIRDWIRLSDVMDQYELGPNGAQIMAADLIALRLGDLQGVLQEFRAPIVLVDTPGQTELFVFRESGRITMELLAPGRSVIVFLFDPFLAKRPSAFVSMLMLSATTQFRFGVPLINVISKRDLLKDEELARVANWSEEPASLEDALLAEKPDLYTQMTTDAFRVLDAMQGLTKAYAVSGESLEGMDDVYSHIQGLFHANEDLKSD